MDSPSISIYSYSHLFVGLWLFLYAIAVENHLALLLLGGFCLLFSGWLLRNRERINSVRVKRDRFLLPLFGGLDVTLILILALIDSLPQLPLLALLIVFAYAADYGIRYSLYTSVPFFIIITTLNLWNSSLNISREDIQWMLPVGAMFAVALLFGHKTDQQRKQRYTDALTGLPSRAHFLRSLTTLIKEDRQQARTLGVLLMEIGQFRELNETLGYGFGDQLLTAIGQRLRILITSEEIIGGLHSPLIAVSRYDGDRFAVTFEGFVLEEQIETIAKRLIQAFEQPWKLYEHELELQLFGGLACYPRHSKHVRALIEHAKMSLNRAKQKRVSLYTYAPESNSSYTERFVIEAGMRRALERDEFIVHYQPKININSGSINGIEALVRWNHPELGLLQPNKFISVAEENRMIIELGEWILRTACKQHAAWLAMKLAPVRICVNVSLIQLEFPGFVNQVLSVLDEFSLQPIHLELEITESLAMKNSAQIEHVLRELANAGVKLTIDDFGTGYASYNHLSHLPIHALKIDKSFLRGINQNPDSEAIVSSIIQLAKSLQLTVTAEGVETFEQLMFLKRQSCDEVQGYLYMQPEPANVLEPYLMRGFAHISKAFQ